MKNIFKTVILISLGFFISCEDDLDINTNPNSPPQINTGLALASAEASLMTVMGGELTNYGGFFAQYHTQGPGASQYENIDQYNLTTAYANRLWTELYSGCLTDLKYVEEESVATNETGVALMAVVLKAYTYQVLVDLFNDVPYTEALQGESNITPSPTPGSEIYTDLIAKIDAALVAYNSNPVLPKIGKQDYINGTIIVNNEVRSVDPTIHMERWIKTANTLKLKLLLRMSYTSQANSGAVNALISQNNFIDEDVEFDNFGTAVNQRNPFFEVQITRLGDVNNIASSSLHEFYTTNSDPRRARVYRPTTSGSFVALAQGAGAEFTNTASSYSRPNVTAGTPVYFLTVAESNFLQAEGLIRYSGGIGAKEKYDAGVEASFDTYGISGQAAPFLIAGGAYEYQTGGSVEQTLRQVIVQKWASLAYVNNIEAYFETVRTKFPEVVTEGSENYAIGNRIPSRISVRSDNSVPSILFYPDNETNRNPNINQHSSLFDKVWWDQKN